MRIDGLELVDGRMAWVNVARTTYIVDAPDGGAFLWLEGEKHALHTKISALGLAKALDQEATRL